MADFEFTPSLGLDAAGLPSPFAAGQDESSTIRESSFPEESPFFAPELEARQVATQGQRLPDEAITFLAEGQSEDLACSSEDSLAHDHELFDDDYELEVGSSIDEDEPADEVKVACDDLAREWSRRRGGNPTAEAIASWLLTDRKDAFTGARLRWGKRFGAKAFTRRKVGRAWLTARRHAPHEQCSVSCAVGCVPAGRRSGCPCR